MNRLVALFVLLGLMAAARWVPLAQLTTLGHQATLSLGFILIFGFLVGHFAAQLSLPRITGYILAGIMCGPYVGRLLTANVVGELQLIDDLALALIAFTAGGELRIKTLRPRLRSILSITVSQTLVTFAGMIALAYLMYATFPKHMLPSGPVLGVALVLGLIGVAKSPATTVALINEYKARGPFTDTVLGVTVIKDVVVLVLITLLLPLVRVITMPETGGFDMHFVGDLVWGVGGSLVGGLVLGAMVTLYMRGVGAVLPIFIVGIALLVSQVARQFHLEALLLCMVAGFVIENATSYGDRFIQAIERSALPVYVVFFAIGGASLDINALRATWLVTCILVVARVVLVYISTVAGEKLSKGGNTNVIRYGWLGFLTQAGVTLGLATIVARKFPEWGPEVKTIALAMIAVNQLIGPVGFRWALFKSGETGADQGEAPAKAV